MKEFFKTIVFIVVAILVIVSAILLSNTIRNGDVETSFGGQSNVPLDVIGTKVGTTTNPVQFRVTSTGGQTSSTTYPVQISEGTDLAIITIGVDKASSSANFITSILGSYDPECYTATTTTSNTNRVIVDDVHWVDIADHLANTVHSTILTATSVLFWNNPFAGTTKSLTLENLNYNCIALRATGSSTEVWAEVLTKEYN